MKRYFEGWYFKQESDAGNLAFIPAIHVEDGGFRSASLQIITPDASYYILYPYEQFSADRKNLNVKMGKSRFAKSRIDLDVHTEEVTAAGTLLFGSNCPIRYDIMGPFRFLPFMECRHSVFSMYHSVSGRLSVNSKNYTFQDGAGYMEGDRGRSFPERYCWSQCSWMEDTPCSLMLSTADIPYLGMKFTGVLCVIVHKDREIRLATYLGAKVVSIGGNRVEIRQGDSVFSAELLERKGHMLRAPIMGSMTRVIRENPSCRARYRFTLGGKVLFDFVTEKASFEYEYNS